MAKPIAGVIAWARRNTALAVASVAGGGVVLYALASGSRRAAVPAAGAGLAEGAAIPAPLDAAALIAQGAGLALQGAGLGLPLVQGGLNLAGEAVGSLASVAGILAGSQADTAATIGGVAGTLTGVAAPIPVPAPAPAPAGVAAPIPVPAPAPAPAGDALVGYTLIVGAAGQITAYVVSSTCSLTPRELSFSKASSAPVTRRTCNGRVLWQITAGGYSGVSFVAGLSGGAWYVRKTMRRADGSTYAANIAQSGG